MRIEVEEVVEAEGFLLQLLPSLDEHWSDTEVSEIGQKGVEPKAIVQMWYGVIDS